MNTGSDISQLHAVSNKSLRMKTSMCTPSDCATARTCMGGEGPINAAFSFNYYCYCCFPLCLSLISPSLFLSVQLAKADTVAAHLECGSAWVEFVPLDNFCHNLALYNYKYKLESSCVVRNVCYNAVFTSFPLSMSHLAVSESSTTSNRCYNLYKKISNCLFWSLIMNNDW